MNALTNDDSFRDFLLEQDDEQVRDIARRVLCPELMLQSLIEFANGESDTLGVWLYENEKEFTLNPYSTSCEQDMTNEIVRYLETLSDQRRIVIYRNYVESYGVIEDLLQLSDDEKLWIISRLTNETEWRLELKNSICLN